MCLKKFGVGRWVSIVDSGVLPGRGLLYLVHFSAQRKRFLWDRGCV